MKLPENATKTKTGGRQQTLQTGFQSLRKRSSEQSERFVSKMKIEGRVSGKNLSV